MSSTTSYPHTIHEAIIALIDCMYADQQTISFVNQELYEILISSFLTTMDYTKLPEQYKFDVELFIDSLKASNMLVQIDDVIYPNYYILYCIKVLMNDTFIHQRLQFNNLSVILHQSGKYICHVVEKDGDDFEWILIRTTFYQS